jgi:hypothetical protein
MRTEYIAIHVKHYLTMYRIKGDRYVYPLMVWHHSGRIYPTHGGIFKAQTSLSIRPRFKQKVIIAFVYYRIIRRIIHIYPGFYAVGILKLEATAAGHAHISVQRCVYVIGTIEIAWPFEIKRCG